MLYVVNETSEEHVRSEGDFLHSLLIIGSVENLGEVPFGGLEEIDPELDPDLLEGDWLDWDEGEDDEEWDDEDIFGSLEGIETHCFHYFYN